MSYTTSGITGIVAFAYDGALIVRGHNSNTDKLIQCYQSGRLVAHQPAPAEDFHFTLPGFGECDLFFLLAVDVDGADTDYFSDAFPTAATRGNRIEFEAPQTIATYLPRDLWRCYRGDAGDGSADTEIHEQPFYPGARRACGYGAYFGTAYGWDGADVKGYGYNYGYGEFGFDCEMLSFTTDPLSPGVYPVKITVVDEPGNESSDATDTVTLNTFARPASDLTVDSYTKVTDSLVLSWTDSEDV